MYRQMYKWVMKVMNRTIQYFCLETVKSFHGESANHVRRASEWQSLWFAHSRIYYIMLYSYLFDSISSYITNKIIEVIGCIITIFGQPEADVIYALWVYADGLEKKITHKGQGIFNKVLDQSTFVCCNFLQMLT